MLTLVTGATGHLGAALVRALLRRGHTVRALARSPSPALAGLGVTLLRGDVTDRASLEGPMDGVEIVYHLAAAVSIQASDDAMVSHINTVGPRNVAAVARERGVRRLVHFSSVHALAPPAGDGATTEELPPNLGPHATAYDRSKVAGEAEIQAAVQAGLDAVVLNPTGVVGPFDFRPRLSNRLILDVARCTLPALTEGGFDWVDVRDVAEGAIAAAERGRTGERYLLSGRWVGVAELGALSARLAGVRPPRLVVPWLACMGLPFAALRAWITGEPPLYTRASLTAVTEHTRWSKKAADELGYRARPPEQTVADALLFFRMTGLMDPSRSEGSPLLDDGPFWAEGAA